MRRRKMTVELIDITENPMKKLANIAAVCYKTQPSKKVVKKIIKLGHLSVLEHCYATLRVQMSVACLLQITRHRHFSFTVQSSRHTELKDAHYTGDAVVDKAIAKQMEIYQEVLKKCGPEKALYCLPKAAVYDVYITGNFRTWLEYFPKRLCLRAMDEHRWLAQEMLRVLKEACPEIFETVRPMCKTCKETNCAVIQRRMEREARELLDDGKLV